MRENLDPDEFYSDRQLAEALRRSKLDRIVARLGGLGKNRSTFSVSFCVCVCVFRFKKIYIYIIYIIYLVTPFLFTDKNNVCPNQPSFSKTCVLVYHKGLRKSGDLDACLFVILSLSLRFNFDHH